MYHEQCLLPHLQNCFIIYGVLSSEEKKTRRQENKRAAFVGRTLLFVVLGTLLVLLYEKVGNAVRD